MTLTSRAAQAAAAAAQASPAAAGAAAASPGPEAAESAEPAQPLFAPTSVPRWVKKLAAATRPNWPLALGGANFTSARALWAFCSGLQASTPPDGDLEAPDARVLLALLRAGSPTTAAALAAAEAGEDARVRVVQMPPRPRAEEGGGAAEAEEGRPTLFFAVVRPPAAGAGGEGAEAAVTPFSFQRAMNGLAHGAEAATAAEAGGKKETEEAGPALGRRRHKAFSLDSAMATAAAAAVRSPPASAQPESAPATAPAPLAAPPPPQAAAPLSARPPPASSAMVRPQPTSLSGWATQAMSV